MGGCEEGAFTVCVRRKKLFFPPFGRMTFHWCDWREVQQQRLGVHAKNGSFRQCMMEAQAVPRV